MSQRLSLSQCTNRRRCSKNPWYQAPGHKKHIQRWERSSIPGRVIASMHPWLLPKHAATAAVSGISGSVSAAWPQEQNLSNWSGIWCTNTGWEDKSLVKIPAEIQLCGILRHYIKKTYILIHITQISSAYDFLLCSFGRIEFAANPSHDRKHCD